VHGLKLFYSKVDECEEGDRAKDLKEYGNFRIISELYVYTDYVLYPHV